MKKSNYLFALALGASTLTYAQVGIGTSSPSNALDIETTGPAIDINDTGGGDPEINFQISGTTTFSIGIDNSDSDKLKIGTTAPDASTAITVLSTGEVGIGTSSPTADLELGGADALSMKFDRNGGGAFDFEIGIISGGHFTFKGGGVDAPNELMRIDAGGSVGIGTTSPSTLLHISNDDATASGVVDMLTITKSTSGTPAAGIGAGLIFEIEDGGGTEEQGRINVELDDVTNGSEDASMTFDINKNGTMTEVMRIDGTSGFVGMGISNPGANLDLGGSSEVFLKLNRSGAGYDWEFGAISGGDLTISGGGVDAPTEFMRISSTGDMGIMNNSPSVELDVTGDIEYTGTITDVSDKRLKENFESIDSVLTKIMKIKGLSYNMINDTNKTREYGVIAQDVQAVFPEMVTTVDPENGYLGVAYIQLIPVLLEATKEQQAIIEAQKKEIETQKAKLDNQKVETSSNTSASTENAEEIEALKAQVQQLLQLIQQQESASVGE